MVVTEGGITKRRLRDSEYENESTDSNDKYFNLRQKWKQRHMTYIFTARCKDGVVLVADRKFTIDYGVGYEYGDKLIGEIGGIIVGFSGARRIFELYRKEMST